MNLEQKKQSVDELKDLMDSARATVMLSHSGLTVEEVTEFRRALRAYGSGLKVFKNTLLERAIAGTPYEVIYKDALKGPLAVAHTTTDAAGMAKAVVAFVKGRKNITVIGGSLGEGRMNESQLKALSELPSIEVLRGTLLGALVGVPKKLLGIFQAPGRDMVGVLAARERQLGEQAEA
jgi:large subunit ribosomal protein L10